MSARRFAGRSVLVTGAASGIGRATAMRIADEGGDLTLADVQEEALAEAVEEAGKRGAAAHGVRCDVTAPDSVQGAVAAALARFERLDGLCNIAGILRFDHTHELRLEDWNQVLAVNLTGTFLVTQAAIPALLESRGVIVNMSSTAGLAASPWTAAYSASKGGVLALTYSLALEYGKQGLRVNAVCPGAIETPIHASFRIPDGADPKLLRRIMPFDGMQKPEAVADLIAFLASDESRHIHGAAIPIDGGMLM